MPQADYPGQTGSRHFQPEHQPDEPCSLLCGPHLRPQTLALPVRQGSSRTGGTPSCFAVLPVAPQALCTIAPQLDDQPTQAGLSAGLSLVRAPAHRHWRNARKHGSWRISAPCFPGGLRSFGRSLDCGLSASPLRSPGSRIRGFPASGQQSRASRSHGSRLRGFVASRPPVSRPAFSWSRGLVLLRQCVISRGLSACLTLADCGHTSGWSPCPFRTAPHAAPARHPARRFLPCLRHLPEVHGTASSSSSYVGEGLPRSRVSGKRILHGRFLRSHLAA